MEENQESGLTVNADKSHHIAATSDEPEKLEDPEQEMDRSQEE